MTRPGNEKSKQINVWDIEKNTEITTKVSTKEYLQNLTGKNYEDILKTMTSALAMLMDVIDKEDIRAFPIHHEMDLNNKPDNTKETLLNSYTSVENTNVFESIEDEEFIED